MPEEKKILRMASLAAFESGKGKKALSVVRYERSDYIVLRLIREFFIATFGFGCIASLIVLRDSEAFLDQLGRVDLAGAGHALFFVYLFYMIFFLTLEGVLSWHRYNEAAELCNGYEVDLYKLEHEL